jgi:hypothetical protein
MIIKAVHSFAKFSKFTHWVNIKTGCSETAGWEELTLGVKNEFFTSAVG